MRKYIGSNQGNDAQNVEFFASCRGMPRAMRSLLLSIALFAVLIATLALVPPPGTEDRGRGQASSNPVKWDEARLRALLTQMTVAEKVGQLTLVSQGVPLEEQLDAVRRGDIGAMMNVVDPSVVGKYREAAAQSRLKIPLLFGLDAIDVFRIAFPPPLAWAATFRPELAQAAARAVAQETASVGVNWTFAPMVDISRDPRWGRVVEGAGEDPMLGAVMAKARTQGYLAGGLMTTAKHYIGYGAGESGRDYNSALIPTSDLYDRYLPPFRASLDAGTRTVMVALNAINGIPATANPFLLDTVLRRDLAFKGFVTSDYNGIGELINHGVARDLVAASRMALKSGVDMDMEGDSYRLHIAKEMAAGRVGLTELDGAVMRVLRVKAEMGLWDRDAHPAMPSEAQTRQTARSVARESIVLLVNEDNVLPIGPKVRTIALIGAAANFTDDDSWYGPAQLTRPLTESLREALTARLLPGQNLTFADAFTDRCGKTLADKNAAVAAASSADLVVLMVAEDCEYSGEATSRTRLDIAPAQQEMLDALAATGKPIVVIVTAGRPLTLSNVVSKAKAVVFAWLPRTEGRTALAEMLFGEVAPSGKLPMTFPRSVGQIPISYNVLPTSRPPGENRYTSRYLDEPITPLFPFGFGLSYTTFAYDQLKPRAAGIPYADGTLSVDVTVTNTGLRAGQDVAQLYIRRRVASRSRPLRELKAFEKFSLEPGESRQLHFEVPARDLAFHDDEGRLVLEPGPVDIFVGSDSTAALTTTVALE